MAKKYQVIGLFAPETVEADEVIFDEDLLTTTAIGNIQLENGQALIPAKGKTLEEVWKTIFVKESNPTIVQPSVSLTLNQAATVCEIGTKTVISYDASLYPGSYSFGPETGIVPTSWEISDTADNKSTNPSGSFPEIQIIDNMTYRLTATAKYGDGAIPLTNLGNEYPEGQIKTGSKSSSASSGSITGYRNSFYGTLTEKGDLTSDVIRGLTGKSGRALTNGASFSISVPVGALRVVIAYPATLRDLTSVKDVNGMNAEIVSGFTKQTVAIEGANAYTAIDYKVYVMDFANANDTANKLTVTI